MQYLTAVLLVGFFSYLGTWYIGIIEGNFALMLMMATAVTGVYWLGEHFYFLPERKKSAANLVKQSEHRISNLIQMGITQVDGDVTKAQAKILEQPWWLDWTAGLFPVIIVVFIMRSFLFEPFKIPSGSMIPTLWVGDLILVNKFHYGLRLPVFHTKLTEGQKPQRGDVMVFRYPPQPSLDYIKRVVGLPGDEVSYLNKRLSINSQVVNIELMPDFFEEDSMRYFRQYQETFGSLKHNVLNDEKRPAYIPGASNYLFRESCKYSDEGVTCKVPEGYYFMMGDNRDNSMDSRYWGFVPDKNIVGKAFFVWMNFGNLKRIGSFH